MGEGRNREAGRDGRSGALGTGVYGMIWRERSASQWVIYPASPPTGTNGQLNWVSSAGQKGSREGAQRTARGKLGEVAIAPLHVQPLPLVHALHRLLPGKGQVSAFGFGTFLTDGHIGKFNNSNKGLHQWGKGVYRPVRLWSLGHAWRIPSDT